MAGRLAGVSVAALLACAVPRAAIAQAWDPSEIDGLPTPGTPAARKWIATAQLLVQKGAYLTARGRPGDARTQFAGAVAAYLRAIDIGGDANLYLDVAIAEERIGKLVDAVVHLRRAIDAEATRPEVIARATARLDALLRKVGVVTLSVAPDGASIVLAGVELGPAPLRDPLVLLPGTYRLALQAAGFQPRDVELTVESGSVNHRVALERVPMIVHPLPATVVDTASPAPSAMPLYVGAGATALAATGAVIFGALAIGQHGTFTAAATPAPERADARDNGKRFALIADLSLGAAAIAAAATATWYLYSYRPRRPADRPPAPVEAKLDVVPWVQSRSGGAALAGSF